MITDVKEAIDPQKNRPADLKIQVAGPELNFRTIAVDDPKLTGRQIVTAAGFKPADEYGILQWLESGDLEEVRLNETVDIRGDSIERFIVARTDRAFFFELEGERQEWLVPFINGITLKRLAGKSPEDFTVLLEREDQPDREIDDKQRIDLSAHGLEKFKLKPVEKIVTIFVNGEKNPVKITRGDHKGIEIKQAAIEQGVKIQLDFILSLEKANGDTDIIGDNDPVKVKEGQHYTAVADDDNS
ncbi:MAG: multiubiquitin domain-containing protein [Pseudomonadota bacterium]